MNDKLFFVSLRKPRHEFHPPSPRLRRGRRIDTNRPAFAPLRRGEKELAPPAIRGNWCNSCLVFPRTKVTTLLLFRQRKLERVAECVNRSDPRFAPLREALAGGTRCPQRVGDAALPPDICAFGDGHRLEDTTIHLALRKRVDAKPAQRVANFIRRRRESL